MRRNINYYCTTLANSRKPSHTKLLPEHRRGVEGWGLARDRPRTHSAFDEPRLSIVYVRFRAAQCGSSMLVKVYYVDTILAAGSYGLAHISFSHKILFDARVYAFQPLSADVFVFAKQQRIPHDVARAVKAEIHCFGHFSSLPDTYVTASMQSINEKKVIGRCPSISLGQKETLSFFNKKKRHRRDNRLGTVRNLFRFFFPFDAILVTSFSNEPRCARLYTSFRRAYSLTRCTTRTHTHTHDSPHTL